MVNTLKPVSWEAEEYVTHHHDLWWFVGLGVVTTALILLAHYYLGWSFLVLVIVSAIAIIVYILRPPRKIHYTLDNKGLTEGKILHKYDEYRAFGILKEDSHFSAVLIPKKRFGLQVKIYFPEGQGEAIVDQLGNHLPMEEVKPDFFDKIVNFLRI